MPELPEVETIRRNLEATILGRTIAGVSLSGKRLRAPIARALPSRARGRRVDAVRRHGKYLLIDLGGGVSLISHLGMSGRWLFHPEAPVRRLPHVHVRVRFSDDSELWFQDPRRFGLLKLVATDRLSHDPALAILGPDPLASPPSGAWLIEQARGASIAVKNFLLDQKRIAGIGNIYASEILHRAGVDPRRRASSLARAEWDRVAPQIALVLGEAIARMGTTFSMYRTLWNEPGTYGEQLLVYDRAGEPCRRCGTAIRRIVQGQRSTYYCPRCQGRDRPEKRGTSAARGASPPAASRPRRASRA